MLSARIVGGRSFKSGELARISKLSSGLSKASEMLTAGTVGYAINVIVSSGLSGLRNGWFAVCVIVALALALSGRLLKAVHDGAASARRDERDVGVAKQLEGMMDAFSSALFGGYGGVSYSCMLWRRGQAGDCESKRRIVLQHRALSTRGSYDILPLSFGDVGRCCFARGQFLCMVCDPVGWEDGSPEYRDVVPQSLRLIIACPAEIDRAGVVDSVFEIDCFAPDSKSDTIASTGTEALVPERLKREFEDHNRQECVSGFARALGKAAEAHCR